MPSSNPAVVHLRGRAWTAAPLTARSTGGTGTLIDLFTVTGNSSGDDTLKVRTFVS